MKKKTIILDALNGLAWIDGEKPDHSQKTKNTQYYYGKHAERFKSVNAAKKHALFLAKSFNGRVWDRFNESWLDKVEPVKKQIKVSNTGISRFNFGSIGQVPKASGFNFGSIGQVPKMKAFNFGSILGTQKRKMTRNAFYKSKLHFDTEMDYDDYLKR
jgi:hypothetical protein